MAATTEAQIASLAKFILTEAKRCGATDCDVSMRVSDSVDTTVRMGEVESLENAVQSRGLSFRAFVGQNSAVVSTTDFNKTSLKNVIRDTVEMAKASEPDPDAGLPEAKDLARTGELTDLGLYDPSVSTVEPGRKIELAKAAEAAARAFDKRITNSDGCSFSDSSKISAYANSRGFIGTVQSSVCSLQASVIASEGAEMQSGSWWHQSRSLDTLENPDQIGHEAARRALRSLGARKVESQKCPVVFDQRMAANLLGKFLGAAHGGSIYRKSSFLIDKLGTMIASEKLTIVDDPFMQGGLGSYPWGDEGLRVSKRVIVDKGRLEQYFIDGYASRKLKMAPNGGSATNLYIEPGDKTPEEIISSIKNGLYLTGISGFGFNQTTGDYSLGASGLWIVDGQLSFAVDEITIASTMFDMFHAIEAVGNDLEFRSSISAPTLLIGSMTVGGK
ncbi:MAG TPA: TldD/PmbA family protein [Oculatellaceae cyanobacterium]